MQMNINKHILNIDRAALSQNCPRREQFKHTPLVHTVDYIWESMEARQKAISRFRYTDQIGFYSFVLISNKNKQGTYGSFFWTHLTLGIELRSAAWWQAL